jgi:Class II flagellar assembly regulator
MRVDQKSPLSQAASAAPRRGAAGQRFTLASEGTANTAGTAAASPLASVDALVALQGEGDLGERKRRSVKRGNEILDALDRLKAALLSGRVSTAELQAIAARLAERKELSGDPRLDELVSHIELRAQVELAKLGV